MQQLKFIGKDGVAQVPSLSGAEALGRAQLLGVGAGEEVLQAAMRFKKESLIGTLQHRQKKHFKFVLTTSLPRTPLLQALKEVGISISKRSKFYLLGASALLSELWVTNMGGPFVGERGPLVCPAADTASSLSLVMMHGVPQNSDTASLQDIYDPQNVFPGSFMLNSRGVTSGKMTWQAVKLRAETDRYRPDTWEFRDVVKVVMQLLNTYTDDTLRCKKMRLQLEMLCQTLLVLWTTTGASDSQKARGRSVNSVQQALLGEFRKTSDVEILLTRMIDLAHEDLRRGVDAAFRKSGKVPDGVVVDFSRFDAERKGPKWGGECEDDDDEEEEEEEEGRPRIQAPRSGPKTACPAMIRCSSRSADSR